MDAYSVVKCYGHDDETKTITDTYYVKNKILDSDFDLKYFMISCFVDRCNIDEDTVNKYLDKNTYKIDGADNKVLLDIFKSKISPLYVRRYKDDATKIKYI